MLDYSGLIPRTVVLLRWPYIGQSIRKCNSYSTTSGLPTLMGSMWFDSLDSDSCFFDRGTFNFCELFIHSDSFLQ